MKQVSKTEFITHALELFREIEKTGQLIIITDNGKKILEVRKLRHRKIDPLELLKGTVLSYDFPTSPVTENDWESTD